MASAWRPARAGSFFGPAADLGARRLGAAPRYIASTKMDTSPTPTSSDTACWLGRSLSPEEWSENTFTYIGEEMDAHFPWLRYGQLVAGMGEDRRFSVWWAAVFHFSRQMFPGQDLGAAFASREQTEWSDCIVFEDSDAMRHTMEHALKMLQILFRGRSDMFFEFEPADATLEPFLLDDICTCPPRRPSPQRTR